MSSNAFSGVGTKFRRWNGAAWEDIAEIMTIDGPDKKRDTIDVTNMDSPGGYREFIAGFRDAGSIKLSMNFTLDGYDLMNDDFESDTKQTYEIALPDDDHTTFSFLGLVTELPLKVDATKQVTCDVTIKISGQVTMNSGSGPAPS
jgi:predicted secreted protein